MKLHLQVSMGDQCHYCRETGHKLVVNNEGEIQRPLDLKRDHEGNLMLGHIHDDGQWPTSIHWFLWNEWMD